MHGQLPVPPHSTADDGRNSHCSLASEGRCSCAGMWCHTFKVTSLHQGVSRLQLRLLLGVTGWTCRNMPCR